MNVSVNGRHIYVTLSQRNLETLLSKVVRDGSNRTLIRRTEGDYLLTVHAETDADHYGERAPGEVHPLDGPVVSVCRCGHVEDVHETVEYRGSKPRYCGADNCPCIEFQLKEDCQ